MAVHAAAGNAVLGKEKADSERCLECHGEAGAGQGLSQGMDGKFARLDGQYADYLVKQVRDFRNGARKHEFMTMMAKSLDDADLLDIAAYFAAEPVRKGTAGLPLDPAAQRLFEQGDAARGLVACTSCHGANGAGGGAAGPVLKGQGQAYLMQQLHEWRTHTRTNSPGGVMNQQAKALTEAEIAALARYLSSL
ncbi:MAG: c-type cytochrome [Gammaproteobacteria bacterium]